MINDGDRHFRHFQLFLESLDLDFAVMRHFPIIDPDLFRGQDMDKAREAAKDDARINVSEPLSYDETKEIMAAKDCLIVPSLCYENSPTVIYGTHAAGLPVIASRLGGIPELMKENDRLFAPGDENDLIEKILMMADKN